MTIDSGTEKHQGIFKRRAGVAAPLSAMPGSRVSQREVKVDKTKVNIYIPWSALYLKLKGIRIKEGSREMPVFPNPISVFPPIVLLHEK